MNKSIMIGRLTRDPEQVQKNLQMTKYTLAVDRYSADKSADFIDCVCFGKNAEFARDYLHKGTKIAVVGRIRTGSYEAKDGRKVKTFDIVVENQEFVESKSSQDDGFHIPDNPEGLPFN